MSAINILIVEDNEKEIEGWLRTIDRTEPFSSFRERIYYAKSHNEALKILDSIRIDVAILDLRIPLIGNGDAAAAEHGNTLAMAITKAEGIPSVILSGHTDELNDELKSAGWVKRIDRDGESQNSALSWIASNSNLIQIGRVLDRTHRSRKADIMWSSLWANWTSTWAEKSPADVHKAGDRMILAYFNALQDVEGTIFPEECIFNPALGGGLQPGDICRVGENTVVVMAPPCELANAKLQRIPVLELQPFEKLAKASFGSLTWEATLSIANGTSIAPAGHPAKEKTREKIEDCTRNSISDAHHFLPPFAGHGGSWISFRDASIFPRADLEANGIRHATINFKIFTCIMNRYSSWLGRLGQPNMHPLYR